jgi:thiosulfate/3-mercaptopyruvate sulfurtransferase
MATKAIFKRMHHSIVSCEWLAAQRGCADVRILDSTWFLPNSPFAGPGGTAREEFERERIPGAQFLDLDAIGDTSFSTAPHNLPTEETFNELMLNLGIEKSTRVVVYDGFGIFSSVSEIE